jgi:hypothetical protein
MMPPVVAAGAALLRGMRATNIKNGRVKKAAFLPRANGNDRDGLSVSMRDEAYRELHKAIYTKPDCATAAIRVDAVREIGLDVSAAPELQDPMHALITGIPDRTAGPEEKLMAERFAEQLADRARPYDHDRGE